MILDRALQRGLVTPGEVMEVARVVVPQNFRATTTRRPPGSRMRMSTDWHPIHSASPQQLQRDPRRDAYPQGLPNRIPTSTQRPRQIAGGATISSAPGKQISRKPG